MAHILLIDDDEAVRRSLEKILARAGHRVSTAADGAAGLRVLEEASVDLVLTDVYMPEMDGIEILVHIREVEPELPVVAISGGGFASADHVLEDAAQLGADAILAKPFEAGVVVETVGRLLEERTLAVGSSMRDLIQVLARENASFRRLCQQFGAGGTVNGAVNTAAAQEGIVRCIDNSVHRQRRNVGI